MMQEIIDINEKLLKKNNFYLKADEMFNLILDPVKGSFPHHTNSESDIEMYHFDAELFNSWCLWCEDRPWSFEDERGVRILMSVNPYDPDKM